MEIWKPIEGYEGIYEVSNTGKVRSLDRKSYCEKWPNGRYERGRELYLNLMKDGYILVSLNKNSETQWRKVHRLVAEAFIPNPESKRCVNHKNGIKSDNRVENLEWVTASENMKHAYRVLMIPRPTGGKGKPSVRRKLSREQVEAIRKDTRTNQMIAKDYGVCQQTISNVKHGLYYNVW